MNLPHKPEDWDGFVEAIDKAGFEANFLAPKDRDQGEQNRVPFDSWCEQRAICTPPTPSTKN